MTAPETGDDAHAARIAEATDWFARMRGPNAYDARAAFDAWMVDPENARAYAEIEQVWGVTGMSSVATTPQPQAVQTRPAWPRYAMAAAFAIVAIGLAFLLAGYGVSSVRPTANTSTYASQVGEIRTIRLPDDSTVTLDTASRLELAFSHHERRVILLTGRARFSVAHDAARPFIVVAHDKAVIARGTIFDVRVENAAVEVTLLEGAVDVAHDEQALDNAPIVRLAQGQRVTLDTIAPKPLVQPAGADRTAWVSGLLSADAMPLARVIAEANRYSRQKIVLADPALGMLRVTGAFHPGDAEALAAKLSATLKLSSATHSDGTVVIAQNPS